MKRLLISLIAGALASCATVTPDPWQGLTVDIDPAAQPIPCIFPLPSDVIGESVVYDNAGVNDLDEYRSCSEDNASIVTEHASQISELKVARKALVEAGQAQRNIADLRQQMLEDERRHNFFSTIGYWAVIIGMGFAL